MERTKIERLEFRNLSFTIGVDRPLFQDLDFDFPMAGICWVRSAAGAGKSSLLRLLDGLIMPSSGDYLINGQPVNEMSFEEFNKFRLNIGYSFDFGGMISNRTLYQNLSLPLEYHKSLTREQIDDMIRGILQLFGIEEVAHKRPSAVTGSIRKAMCVARAFVHNPQVVLLDDPTTGLREEVKATFTTILKNHTILYPDSVVYVATEDKDFIEKLATTRIDVNGGELLIENHEKRAA